MLFLVLFCISSQSVGMHKRDAQNKSFVQKLFAAMSVPKKVRLDDNQDPMPPDCFRIVQEPPKPLTR